MPDTLVTSSSAVRQRPPGWPVMFQSWRELLFLHWRFDPAIVQAILPAGLTVETFDGSAWVGIVPFLMRNIRPVWSPTVPYVSNFLELNLRTYAVNEDGTPGVWFISLNADRWLAVQIARRWFRLPYHWCSISADRSPDGWTDFRCRRYSTPSDQTCRFRYRRFGKPYDAVPGTLDFFLCERYLLFAQLPQGRTTTGQVHHVPYPLQEVEVQTYDTNLMLIDGLPLPERPYDHVCCSAGVDVDVFGLDR